MSSFVDRIIRASKLDASLCEEVEQDRGAIRQAVAVVICVIGLVVQALFFALPFSIFGAPGRPV